MAVRLTPSIQPFITIVRNSLGLFPALLSATCDPVRKSFPQEDTMWPPFLQENSVSSLHPRKSSYKVCWLDLDSSSPDWSPCRTGALGGVNGRQILLQFLSQPAVPPIEKTPNTEKCPSTVRREEESDIMRVNGPRDCNSHRSLGDTESGSALKSKETFGNLHMITLSYTQQIVTLMNKHEF